MLACLWNIFEAALMGGGAEVLVEHIPNALRYQTTGFSIPICIILVHMDTLFDVGIVRLSILAILPSSVRSKVVLGSMGNCPEVMSR
jgi:hypothetical protein